LLEVLAERCDFDFVGPEPLGTPLRHVNDVTVATINESSCRGRESFSNAARPRFFR
jgi:hypothetical protein